MNIRFNGTNQPHEASVVHSLYQRQQMIRTHLSHGRPKPSLEACVATDKFGRRYGQRTLDSSGDYCGSFADDGTTPEGYGTLCHQVYTYTGEFREGKPHGYGEMRFASGGLHAGFWAAGQAEGYGRYVDAGGRILCEGTFSRGVPKDYDFGLVVGIRMHMRKLLPQGRV